MVEDLPESKLSFNDPKGILHFGAEVDFRRLIQIQKPALWSLWKHSALAGLHGNSELSFALLEIITFLDTDVACIAEDMAFIPMKPGCCCDQLMHVGGGALNRVDQASAGSTPLWQRIPMNHCLPLATECISGSLFSHSVSGSHPG